MNPNLANLFRIVQKPERRVIGLMSGTSLDGLDVALCRIAGSGSRTQMVLERFVTLDYPADFRRRVREVFAKRTIDQQALCGLNAFIGRTHGKLVMEALDAWKIRPEDIDLIASHGQTVYHAPQRLTQDGSLPDSTLQLGDGDHIATVTGITTISDFRQKHIAAGGEGAPLAAYGDFLLFTDAAEDRFLLNIGGISNFTFLPRKGADRKAYATEYDDEPVRFPRVRNGNGPGRRHCPPRNGVRTVAGSPAVRSFSARGFSEDHRTGTF